MLLDQQQHGAQACSPYGRWRIRRHRPGIEVDHDGLSHDGAISSEILIGQYAAPLLNCSDRALAQLSPVEKIRSFLRETRKCLA